jgi:hypothetical protein
MIRVLSNMLLISCLFPFVTPVRFGFDSQPYAFLVSLLLLLIISFRREITLNPVLLGFIITISFGLLTLISNFIQYRQLDWFTGVRSMFTLLNLPIGLLAFLNARIAPGKIFKYVKFAIITYGIVGVIQMFNKNFMSFLLARGSTSDSRGAFSLSVEPVEYARICIFFFIIVSLFRFYNYCSRTAYMRLTLFLFFQILVLSLAGTGFFWVFAIILLFLISSDKVPFNRLILVFLVSILLLGLTVYVGITYFPDKRMFFLINVAIENPNQLASFSGFILRSLNPIHSFLVGIIMYKGLGVGLGFPGADTEVSYSFLGPMFEGSSIGIRGRSHGGISSLIYELGLLAIPYILTIIFFIRNGFKSISNGLPMKFIVYTFLLIVIFDGPLANSILILVIGVFWNLHNAKKYEDNLLHTT